MSSTMASVGWLWALGGCAFGLGCAIVWTLQRSRAVQAHAIGARVQLAPPRARPAAQIVVRSFDEVVADTETRPLLDSIEHRMRLSQANFRADCLPVLQAFAEYVQFLPASESHHHAQPGGLWVHALEVLDAALAIRCGTEMPRGASTEERKRVEALVMFDAIARRLRSGGNVAAHCHGKRLPVLKIVRLRWLADHLRLFL